VGALQRTDPERARQLLPRLSSTKPVIYEGQWISFKDANGKGFAQPDLFIHTGERIIVYECKRTRSPRAEDQVAFLYWPLLYRIYQVPLVGVEVFLNPGPNYVPHPLGPTSFLETLELDDWTLAEWHLLL
jgi:hypothetical protein